ncbi:hypothetical protein BGZ80_010806 [Entomortierella chlamydospora]|uniref:Protein kinase domain-containing protein n=1 Tax=Entomortierella chlamydospora TaxID=101097 RepID=A0A9P6MUT3_9FUNG|nr:hypothetical protein BGZ79_006698 [Entomortierella chlamydospora]KAG0013847.1 hypothetical protein BGZ80_010806 [Entomortierella chlamydospora]
MDDSVSDAHAPTGEMPTILQDDLPLDGSMTTTLSFETGIPPAMMDSNPPNSLTDTLSSFSSTHSSSHGGNNLSTFSSSTTASRRSSMQFTKHVPVRETLNASVVENADGALQLGQYILKGEIGKGAFGKVHLAEDANTYEKYAIKEFSKSKLRKKDKANLFKLGPRGRGRGRRDPEAKAASTSESPLDLIRGEVAILKKLHHPNIVKLYEVLDVANDDSMYMVFEYCEKGVLMPVSLTESYANLFSDAECRDIFQQIVLGIEYLHEHDIIHRDIKPDNLLRSKDSIVKIVDFGVSEMFNKKGDDMTKKSAGSPAFMAPELCRPDHGEVSGRATDVWSMGVTLYCLRYGHLPYISDSIFEMQHIIRESEYKLPEDEDPRFVALIRSLLEKDPSKRATIDQLRDDPWLTNDGKDPLISKEENTTNVVTELTEADLAGAFKKINNLATVVKAIFKLKRGIKSHSPSPSTSSLEIPGADVSEMEKVQDAEEGISNAAHVPVSSENVKEADETQATSDNLEKSIDSVSLEARPEVKEPSDAKETQGTGTSAPLSDSVESEAVKEEPQGYQVCDMESGMCYWVPANSTKPAPTSGETLVADVPEATVKTAEAPVIHVDSTLEVTEQSQTTLAVKEEDVKVTVPTRETPAPRPLSPGPEQMIPSHDRSSSGSTSPGQLLNATPRLVGKLSRERLAMFEQKE